jgi:hypothetical protein
LLCARFASARAELRGLSVLSALPVPGVQSRVNAPLGVPERRDCWRAPSRPRVELCGLSVLSALPVPGVESRVNAPLGVPERRDPGTCSRAP